MNKSVRRGDSFSFSSSSGLSRSSTDRGRKPPRFSLRRIFCRRPSSARSARGVLSSSEIESPSVSSLQASVMDRELSSKGTMTDETHVVYKKTKDGVECPVCLTCQPKENFPDIMTCHHRSCQDCLKKYLRIEITESRVNIACPECNEKFHPNDIQMILEDPDLMLKYEEFMMRRVLVLDPDTRWCPAPDCCYAVIASGCASCPRIKCGVPGCNTFFCYHCKQYWHPNQTCDAARAERSSNLRSSSVSNSHESGSHKDDIKPCPRCGAFIVKMDDGSCNHMTCAVCGAEFCWLCMKEISDLHYLSPSGCTFWGKKPWSRKKKILWQLGTLVGAPVGITLIAGIAVPAIIIGVPVWVGRRLHSRYDYMTKHKRNAVVAGGVTASILISPILAGLGVGIGVPILLAYVYGVVPISLCRSGGCGVTTTNSGGVRFEFDNENEVAPGTAAQMQGGDTQSMETNSHHVTNPSIGPSIGEMSMAMTNSLSASGSHLDRVGALRDDLDRDSASNRAIVGASLNGSLSGSMAAGTSNYNHRLEIQADVSTQHGHKRSSFSSESANFSLDAKSGTVSFGDDASTRALAGSLCYRDKDNCSAVVPPLEVHVDVGAGVAHYHEAVGGAEGPALRPGSPTSSRSVNFSTDEALAGPSGRRFTRHSVSIGNSISENVESLETPSPRSSASYMDNLSMGASSQDCDMPTSCENISSLPEKEVPCFSFTQVENDHPAFHRSLSSSGASSSGIQRAAGKQHNVHLSPGTSSTSSSVPSCSNDSTMVAGDRSSSTSVSSGIGETTVLIDGFSTTSSSS